MKKSPLAFRKQFARLALSLLVASVLIVTAQTTPVAQAQSYPHIPTLPPATATPTPTSTPEPTLTASPAPTEFLWNFPTDNPTIRPTTQSGGFWSPLTIGLVAVALVAFLVPVTFFYMRHGKQKPLLDEKPSFNTQARPASTSSPVASRYQSSYGSQQYGKPTQTLRYGQVSNSRQQPPNPYSTARSTRTSSISRPPAYSKTCPHCKRGIRNDQNVCPYCYKKIK
jgi:hypothetical protein